MTYQEIKDLYNCLDTETRWKFLFYLFGYRRSENNGFKKFVNGQYTWYRPDGSVIYLWKGQTFPFFETKSSPVWFRDGVSKKLENNDFSFAVRESLKEYAEDNGIVDKLLDPMFYFKLPFVEQVFILYLAYKKLDNSGENHV